MISKKSRSASSHINPGKKREMSQISPQPQKGSSCILVHPNATTDILSPLSLPFSSSPCIPPGFFSPLFPCQANLVPAFCSPHRLLLFLLSFCNGGLTSASKDAWKSPARRERPLRRGEKDSVHVFLSPRLVQHWDPSFFKLQIWGQQL